MRATRRRQRLPRDRALSDRERRHHVTLVESCSGRTIEANELDMRMGVKERAEIIGDGIGGNRRVGTRFRQPVA